MKIIFALSLLAGAMLVAPAALANDPGSCAQEGYIGVGPIHFYDVEANPLPSSDSCWYKSSITYLDGSTADACSYYRPRWQFNSGNSSLSQTLTVPSSEHSSTVFF